MTDLEIAPKNPPNVLENRQMLWERHFYCATVAVVHLRSALILFHHISPYRICPWVRRYTFGCGCSKYAAVQISHGPCHSNMLTSRMPVGAHSSWDQLLTVRQCQAGLSPEPPMRWLARSGQIKLRASPANHHATIYHIYSLWNSPLWSQAAAPKPGQHGGRGLTGSLFELVLRRSERESVVSVMS